MRISHCFFSKMVDEEKLPVSQWSSEEVGLWLENIGYGDYYKEFVNDNRIDGQVLLILTENDLKDSLGIRVLGDRKRLWLAINKLQQEHSKSALNLDTYSRKKSLDFKDSAYISSSDSNDDEEGSNSLSLADVSETWRTFLSVLYAFLVFCLTSFVMTVVHDRVPDMKKYPPLPDIILDSVPLIPWAFTMCEFTGIVLWSMWVAVLFLHKHRMILIRRMMALAGTVFLLRCVTMFVTSLSVPGIHLECSGKLYGDVWAKLHRAFEIMFGFGMSVNGVRSCGDYMFSGHTVVITLLNFFITESKECSITVCNANLKITMVGLPPVQKSTKVYWTSVSPSEAEPLKYEVYMGVTSPQNRCECPQLDMPTMRLSPQCKTISASVNRTLQCDITKNTTALKSWENDSGICIMLKASSTRTNYTCFEFTEWSLSDCALCPTPENISLSVTRRRAFTIKWSPPSHVMSQQAFKYTMRYRIFYKSNGIGSDEQSEDFGYRGDYTAEIRGLAEWEDYNVWVECSFLGDWSDTACRGEQAGPYTIRTLQGAPSEPPKICGFDRISDVNGKLLLLRFKMPSNQALHGDIISHEIQYCNRPSERDCFTANITSLTPAPPSQDACDNSVEGRVRFDCNVTCSFRIRICTAVGCSPWSSPSHNVSLDVGPPERVRGRESISPVELWIGIGLVVFIVIAVFIACVVLKCRERVRRDPIGACIGNLEIPYRDVDRQNEDEDDNEYDEAIM
ncbi:uncharacterized protein LOC5514553 [Nematostella vectensis]|uniref:uncharacterized protein LOC5514553 n=1 Tax=Nematostella vectensis TaxID=45351 RepID=UPI0020770F1A|nr:uncharacterized protein LOC5514553 [Nematostella vectensis]